MFIYIIKCPGICEILLYSTGHRLVLNKSYEEILLGQSLWITLYVTLYNAGRLIAIQSLGPVAVESDDCLGAEQEKTTDQLLVRAPRWVTVKGVGGVYSEEESPTSNESISSPTISSTSGPNASWKPQLIRQQTNPSTSLPTNKWPWSTPAPADLSRSSHAADPALCGCQLTYRENNQGQQVKPYFSTIALVYFLVTLYTYDIAKLLLSPKNKAF